MSGAEKKTPKTCLYPLMFLFLLHKSDANVCLSSSLRPSSQVRSILNHLEVFRLLSFYSRSALCSEHLADGVMGYEG